MEIGRSTNNCDCTLPLKNTACLAACNARGKCSQMLPIYEEEVPSGRLDGLAAAALKKARPANSETKVTLSRLKRDDGSSYYLQP